MTNKEKFLAGKWFSIAEASEYSFDLFSLCTESNCIQDRNRRYHCIVYMHEEGITCTLCIMSTMPVSVDVQFSEMFFYTDEQADKILKT